MIDKALMACSGMSLSGAFSVSLEGLNKAAGRVQQAANNIAAATDPANNTDTLDLSTAMVALMEGRNAFAANIKTIQAQDEVQKSLLNLFG